MEIFKLRQLILWTAFKQLWDGTTHRLVRADGVDLSAEHDRGEDQEKETLEAEHDEEDNRHRWREAAALCRKSTH